MWAGAKRLSKAAGAGASPSISRHVHRPDRDPLGGPEDAVHHAVVVNCNSGAGAAPPGPWGRPTTSGQLPGAPAVVGAYRGEVSFGRAVRAIRDFLPGGAQSSAR